MIIATLTLYTKTYLAWGAMPSAVLLPFENSAVAAATFLAVPVVCTSIYIAYSERRARLLPSPLLPGVSLLLIPLCLQVLYTIVTLVEGFRTIATQKTAGQLAVYGMLVGIERSTLWSTVEVALGVTFLAAFSALRTIRKTKPVSEETALHRGERTALDLTLILIIVAMIAAGVLYWSSADTVHLITLVVDPAQQAAFTRRFGQAELGAFAAYITRSLIIQAVVTVNLIFMSLVFGIKALTNYVPQRRDAWISSALAVLLLAGLGGAITESALSIRHMQNKIAARTRELQRDSQ